MEVCDFCLMDNHFHLILRNRPDLVPLFSDEEVVRRWWHILRQRGESGLPVDPSPLTMRLWMNDPSQMESYRRRLSDISCFMQRYSEYIARRATVKTVNMASSSRNDSRPPGFWMTKHCWLAVCM